MVNLAVSFQLLDNHDWYQDMTMVDFLTTTGRYISANEILTR